MQKLSIVSLVVSLFTLSACGVDTCDPANGECKDPSIDDLGPRCRAFQGSVARKYWPDGKPFATEIVAEGVPVVLENTMVKDWEALNKWTREYVKNEMFNGHAVPNVDVRMQSATLYNKKTDLGELSIFTIRSHSRDGETMQANGEPFNGNYTNEKQSLLTITENKTIVDPEGNARRLYSYHSGPIRKWGEHVEKEVEPWDLMKATDDRMVDVVGNDASHGIIHFGEAGVVAQMHHDRNRNFFGQVVGRKRVLLFEPEAHFNMYTYPITHPSRRQSQVSFQDGDGSFDSEKFPEFSHSRCWETVIGPGDLLYIPPFWFHMVQYVDFAASFSVVSPSMPQWLFSKIYSVKLPLQLGQNQDEKSFLMARYVSKVLRTLGRTGKMPSPTGGYGDLNDLNGWAQKFPIMLSRARFDPLRPFMKADFNLNLLADPSDESKRGCWFHRHISAERLKVLQQTSENELVAAAKEAELLLAGNPDSMMALGYVVETEIMLGDWIEEYARYMVGVNNVPLFVDCLADMLSDNEA